jgi:SPP1 family predicted phage head-tail adaptor
MRAGKRDRRVVIERVVISRDAFNAPVETWVPLPPVWAGKVNKPGAERFAAQEVSGLAVRTFEIRYRRDLTVKDRIVYDGRTWNITDVREIGRRKGIEIDCVARAESEDS